MANSLSPHARKSFERIPCLSGLSAYACLAKPLKPQYNGGIVSNPEFEYGLNGWKKFGNGTVEHKTSPEGNKYISASQRILPFDSFSQTFDLKQDHLYSFSAWLQVSHGEDVYIAAMFKTKTEIRTAGWVIARHGCWTMLKGGFNMNISTPAEFYFETKNTTIDIWVDNVSLQPFTLKEWKLHQYQNIEKKRKSQVKFQVTDFEDNPIANAKISLEQVEQAFPFGNAVSEAIIYNKAYQSWFASRFKYTVFENEMKWYSNEKYSRQENYSIPDAMLNFAQKHNITVRGHNILWNDPRFTPTWVKNLPKRDLPEATDRRINSIVRRYSGKVIHWDVINENMHFSQFEDKMGRNASTVFLEKAYKLDKKALPFLNEFNTIERPKDSSATATKYLDKIKLIRKQGYLGPLGIGLEGHFAIPNLPYVRASIDMLAATNLPIWITELDVQHTQNESVYLDQVLRELHAHPAIQGIIMWAAWRPPRGCWRMCLTDNDFNNLATGDVVDNIIREWTHKGFVGTTDSDGYFSTSLFHGVYEARISHFSGEKSEKINECLAKPEEAHYGGGIVVNPELNHGLKGWTIFGDGKVEHQESEDGNKYVVVSNRNGTFNCFTQKFNLEKDKLYMFSAWLRVSQGEAHVAAMFKTQTGYQIAGWTMAQKGCWSMLKGGIVVNSSSPAYLYFETEDTSIDIMVDSISLQPFTHEEWKSHRDQNIEKIRKSKVKFQAVDKHGQPLANATISIKQNQWRFPFGCAINQNILSNTDYKNWFLRRFKYTVFENEMKWYVTESSRGQVNYHSADAMLELSKTHNIQVRGHNVFWEDPRYQPNWIGGISKNDLLNATEQRIISIVNRYIGQLIHWDVVNENLHFSYYESKLGGTASTSFYKKANEIDPSTTPFLNDYNTIEDSRDGAASPAMYLQKINQLRREGYMGHLGIGLEGHFQTANLPYIRASLDQLTSAKLPIWITELDVQSGPNQAKDLEQIIREVYAHGGVEGIIIWAAWSPQGCYRMCLTDNNFKNLETGNVVDKILSEIGLVEGLNGTTDSNGYFETSLFHGVYEVQINHPTALSESYNVKRFNVASMDRNLKRTTLVKIRA
ncbi:unnamed protein product [Fraxinus pennsylvanica]|uniref:GH10 domain-containing protein n=1 Tax=Fraxinus pennsylvanica TaxID=56036 RepID=A0AAD1ZHN2_9LAMI|nr:unnamed protein product [Fraxinus pennsylvanica]